MLDTAVALQSFFSGFGLPAFPEYAVPDALYDEATGEETPVEPPYITYELREPEPGEKSSLTARVWYIDTDYTALCSKVDQIKAAIGRGVSISVDGGAVWLWPDTHFCQFQRADEPKLKIAYLMLIIGAYKF